MTNGTLDIIIQLKNKYALMHINDNECTRNQPHQPVQLPVQLPVEQTTTMDSIVDVKKEAIECLRTISDILSHYSTPDILKYQYKYFLH